VSTPVLATRLLRTLGALALVGSLPFPAAAQGGATGGAPRTVWPDEGPRTWAPRPTETEITANDLRTRLYQIADDSMAGRRIGELGNLKTTDYIAREFRRLGLKPAGDSGTYFQVLPYGPLGFDVAALKLTVDGRALVLRADWVPTTPSAANGLTGTIDVRGAAVFAGTWGDTAVALDPARFKGKVAVFLADPASAAAAARGPAPLMSCADVPNKFGARAAAEVEAAQRANPSAIARRGGPATVRDRRAETAGAIGVLVIGLDAMSDAARGAAYAPRSTMRPAGIPGEASTLFGATISDAVVERIFGRPAARLTVGTTGRTITANYTYEWRPSAYAARNVIAVLPGSDPARAAEYVLVGAHNDHVGTAAAGVDHDSLRAVNAVTRRQGANDPACAPTAAQQREIDALIAKARAIRPPRRDSIFNGADDDGSGTAVLLEIAERFAAEKPARSIIFISHQGEESGLLGSRWFVDHPTVPLGQIVAAHNMDMLGKGRVEQVKFGGPNSVQTLGARRLSREFGDIIDSVNAVRAEPMAIDKSWDVTANPMNRFCRSDQVNYVNKNIPVTYFSLGYALDYHQLTDDPQYIDYDHSARLGRFIHDVMLAIAVRPDRPAIAGQDPAYPSCGR
jgi:Zn-dependent M28 family amino/carboxypeptidase